MLFLQIDEHTLTDRRSQLGKDPFPIYTVTDKQSKQEKGGGRCLSERISVLVLVSVVICWCFLSADPWFEITPHEAGYSLTGAFVNTSSFGSQFDNGSKKKHQPEMDMLYLQGMSHEFVNISNTDVH